MNYYICQSIVITLSLIFAVQVFYLPWLVSFTSVIAISYFAQHAFRQRQMWPTRKIYQYSYVVVSCFAVYWHFKTVIGVEAGCALLFIFLIAKCFEVKASRDLVVVFNYALFVIASTLLYSQGILNALVVVIATISVFMGLYRIQSLEFVETKQPVKLFKQELKPVLKAFAIALPFFLILFLFFPRFPPLWYVPIKTQSGVTGLSDHMQVGDIAELSQSRELAFRILVDPTQMPGRSQLYWRAMVLDRFDGKTWTTSGLAQMHVPLEQVEMHQLQAKNKLNYQYLPKDLQSVWISALETSRVNSDRFVHRQDGGIVPYRPLRQVQPIQLTWLGAEAIQNKALLSQFDPARLEHLLSINRMYPENIDPKSQALAQNLWRQSQGNTQAYIQAVLNWYKQQGFVYTLRPTRISGHVQDQFLFNTREGFCEHYAASFTLLMRYVGIPARVVTGYQGGALAPDAKSWEVRQLDAHAWAEVWIDEKNGWVRFDPTAIISPARIDGGMQSYVQENTQSHGMDAFEFQQMQFLTKIQIWSDYLNYQWQSKILGYDVEQQKQWLSRLGLKNIAHYLLVALFLSFALIGLFILWKQLASTLFQKDFNRAVLLLSDQLETHGLAKQPIESVEAWLQRLKPFMRNSDVADQLVKQVIKSRYRGENSSGDEKLMIDLLKQCSKELKLK